MESIDHILSKMREPSCFKGKIPVGRVDADFRYFADRIEAAVKVLIADRDNWRRQALDEDARANAATCEKSSQVGNTAKMRKALENSNGLLEELALIGEWSESVHEQIAENKAALTDPARYCDVMSLELARKLWFAKEIMPRLTGNLPLGKEIPFEEWFVSQMEQEAKGEEK